MKRAKKGLEGSPYTESSLLVSICLYLQEHMCTAATEEKFLIWLQQITSVMLFFGPHFPDTGKDLEKLISPNKIFNENVACF